MADLSKRYNHDGISFLAFTLGLSMPYCAHFRRRSAVVRQVEP